MTERKKFTIINNDNLRGENFENERKRSIREYQTNPLKMHGNSLKEELMKFTNGEAGRRFTVEDLLRGC